MTLIPAYGRDYKSQKAVLEDWKSGKDFQIVSMGPDFGRYTSRRDWKGQQVMIRYKSMRQIMVAYGEK